MIDRTVHVFCDLCKKKRRYQDGVAGWDELEACRNAKEDGWTIIDCGYGNELHVCRRCSANRTEESLYAEIMASIDHLPS